MSVVINEFEVVTEPPPGQAEGRSEEESGEPAPRGRLSPMELRELLRWQALRHARLRAD